MHGQYATSSCHQGPRCYLPGMDGLDLAGAWACAVVLAAGMGGGGLMCGGLGDCCCWALYAGEGGAAVLLALAVLPDCLPAGDDTL